MKASDIYQKHEELLTHKCVTIPAAMLHLPSKDSIKLFASDTDRSEDVVNNLSRIYSHGRLKDTGYISILPVDQGIEHSAGKSFVKNPEYFDPARIVELAIEGGCNAVASTFGVLGAVSKKYADKIPFVVKINHNEMMTTPAKTDQIMFGTVEQASNMGAVGVGATVYFGAPESNRQIVEVSQAFARAHELGMATILWCYTRNEAFKTSDADYHTAADLTGQANHLGVTMHADVIKQKLPETNLNGFDSVGTKQTDPRVYLELLTESPIDQTRYQLANCYMGRIPLINSGGPSGDNDFEDAVVTAIVNKRAGGAGLIAGRKAFQRPFSQGVKLLNAIQDVYLDENVTIA